MTVKQIPPLKRKKIHKIDPDSLTAALYWDQVAKESLGDADIPFASNEGGKKATKGGPGSGWFAPPKGTHTSSRLSPEVRQQAVKDILQVQRYGLDSGNEAATAIDADGNRINGTPKGDKLTCNIDKLITGKEHVIIHNHPNSISFTNQDVALLWTTKAQHLIVVGHDGTLYRLSKTLGTETPPLGDKGQFASLAVLNWGRYVGEHENKFITPVGLGQMSREQAWKEQTHLGMVDFADAYNLDYERILP